MPLSEGSAYGAGRSVGTALGAAIFLVGLYQVTDNTGRPKLRWRVFSLAAIAFLGLGIACRMQARPAAAHLLLDAAAAGDVAAVRRCLDHPANLEAQGSEGRTPLLLALFEDHPEVAEVLIEHGANPRARDALRMTALHMAPPANVARLLLDRGADPNAEDVEGRTPLQIAAYGGRTETAKLLLDHGARIDANAKHLMTPLHWAVFGGHQDVTALLIQRGAGVNVRGKLGKTPLHVADNGSIARLLVEAGAELGARDEGGATPVESAAAEGRDDVVRVLEDAARREKPARRRGTR